MSERGEGRNGSGHDLSASRASVGCLSCQGVFDRSLSVFVCVKVLLRAWSEEEMVSWPDLFLQLITISNHISFPRPPISDFRYFITPFVLPCV